MIKIFLLSLEKKIFEAGLYRANVDERRKYLQNKVISCLVMRALKTVTEAAANPTAFLGL